MPAGTGFFINNVSKSIIPIFEHILYIQANPESLGLKRSDVEGLDPYNSEHREQLIAKAIANGWTRVRILNDRASIEFYGDWDLGVELVREIVNKYEIGDYSILTINNLSEMNGFNGYVKSFVGLPRERLSSNLRAIRLGSGRKINSIIDV